MAKEPKWKQEEIILLNNLLDKRKTYREISEIINRSINGIKIAMRRKLHYQPKCLDCDKRLKRKANQLRCSKCEKKYRKIQKRKYAKENQEKFRKLRNELRFGGNREKTLIRDMYTCQMCGKTHHEVVLDVHHKDKTGRNKKYHNNSLDNLITYCHSCHTKQHKEDTIMKRWKKPELF